MRDRTPTKALENGALRYGVYAEDGSLLRYEYLAPEDDPTDPGTELSKATLLQDSTEVSLFGSATDRTVDDAFAGIAGQLNLIKSDAAAITLTVQDTNGKPIPEVLVQGILSESGQAVYTNANGVASGYIGEGQQPIKVTGYADIEDYTETLTVVKGTTITKTIKLTTRNFLKLTSSKSVKFSGNVNQVDVTAVGGGGGGDASDGYEGRANGAGGGGGGYCTVQENVIFQPNTLYEAIVGAGGEGFYSVSGSPTEYDATDGGSSSFLGVIAMGGKHGNLGLTSSAAGAGNGRGGYFITASDAYNAVAGSIAGYSSFTETVMYGGGGSGVWSRSSAYYTDAAGYGGNSNDPNGVNGFGGGGSAYSSRDGGSKAGNGGSGCVAIRMHLKSAV